MGTTIFDQSNHTCGVCGNATEGYITEEHGTLCRRCIDRLDRAEVAAEAVFPVSDLAISQKDPGGTGRLLKERDAKVRGATLKVLGAWAEHDDETHRWQATERMRHAAKKRAGCTFRGGCECEVCDAG